MTSALNSHFGLAKQTGKGSAVTANGSFKYFYFSDGTGISPVPIVLPLDQEIGSGPLIRDVKKVGVSSGGAINFIPRPDSLGLLLLGALGDVSTASGVDLYTHTLKFASDPFTQPYFTARRRVASIGGDIASDVKLAQLQFNFRAANFLRASAGFVGIGEPSYIQDASVWSADDYLDDTPPFLTCKGSVDLPDGNSLKAIEGSLTVGNVIPLQEQFILGSYTPDDAELNSRAVAMRFVVKADVDLYEKMMYDPAQSGAWVPDILKEADMSVEFETAEEITAGNPYKISFHFNGQDQASGNGNVAWSVEPISLRGNRQVLMAITGIVLADTTGATDGPFSAQLVNDTPAY